MLPDVGRLLRRLRVPGFSYREQGAAASDPPPAQRLLGQAGPAIVALVSLERGVGRTTLAANLAAALAMRGARALAFDLDPAAELALHFRAEPPADPARARAPGPASIHDPQVRWSGPRLGWVPFGQEIALALEPLAGECDVMVLDTPPDPSTGLQRALAEADEVLVVAHPDKASFQLVSETESLLAQHRMRSWRRSRARYLLNRFDGRRAADQQALAAFRARLGSRLIGFPIQQDPAVRAALTRGRLVQDEAPGSQVVADLAALARLLLPRRGSGKGALE